MQTKFVILMEENCSPENGEIRVRLKIPDVLEILIVQYKQCVPGQGIGIRISYIVRLIFTRYWNINLYELLIHIICEIMKKKVHFQVFFSLQTDFY